MLGAGLSAASVAVRRRGTAPGWPEDAVALWLIFGQSNAEGYAPWRQDPLHADPSAAVPALTDQERACHPWLRLSTRGYVPTAGQFPSSGQGIATDAAPRSSGHVWGAANTYGIPDGTQCFGPEIGLVRHVLSGAAPADWRDDADPRLFILKQTEGGKPVDHFRWGGPGQSLILDALRQGGGENLSTLAADRRVLVQGLIFVIGERDANDLAPDGTSMAGTLSVRFADWVRQIRGALGVPAPALFVEIHDHSDADKRTANAALAALAGAIPNAAVLERQSDWNHVGDGVHYDAQGQDRIGAAVFDHIRNVFGRAGDGLVTGFEFSGLKPWFHVPPVFVDQATTQMRIAATPSVTGKIHARVTAAGAPAPPAEEIRDGSGEAGGFQRAATADEEVVWYSPAGSFTTDQAHDCHFVLEDAAGLLGETTCLRRGANAKFAPDLGLDSADATTADLSLTPSFPGELFWALHAGDVDWMRPEDVESFAFGPVQGGSLACLPNQAAGLSLAGLSPSTTYTLFVTGRRSDDGARSVTQRAMFSTA